ncbi:MAG: DNA primase family protein [Gemmataceae bacterium]
MIGTKTTRQDIIEKTVDWLRVLVSPDQVTELRALGVQRGRERPHTVSGFFDYEHLELMAEQAVEISRFSKGVYFTLNPLRPDILARRANRIDYAEEGKLAKDVDVLARRWLLIDADPVRDSHVSATDSEKIAALEMVQKIKADVAQHGWPAPILADSGNGYHLFYRIDLPAEDDALVEGVLKALAAKHDSAQVHVDQKVFNPARICKIPGTLARKGDHVSERPHRRAKLLDMPSEIRVVSRDLLEALAAGVGKTEATSSSNGAANGQYQHRLLVDRWLQDRGVSYRVKREVDSRGRTIYLLGACPLDSSHAAPDSCIMQSPDGRLAAQCFHASCAGKGWQEFKLAIGKPEPHHYDPPLPAKSTTKYNRGDNAGLPTPGLGRVNESFDDPHRLARTFRARFQVENLPTLHFHRQSYCRWDGRAYREVKEKEIRGEITESIKADFDRFNLGQIAAWRAKGSNGAPPTAPKVTTKCVGNALQALASMALLPGSVEPPAWIGDGGAGWQAADVLACKNALVHLPGFVAGEQDCIRRPTPAFFSCNAVDYDFNAAAPKPAAWLAFLDHLWHRDAEAVATLQEWFGYCLLPDTSQQKILMLIGPKRGGKGTIARVLSKLLGLHNVAAPTLSTLALPFGLQPLLGKNLAIISDARLSQRTDAAAVVERLLSVSGEDGQTVDRKFLESLTVKLNVRFMILTNELPKLNDPSGALVGRMILLRLTECFFGREDTTLTATLHGELPGILLWAIEGWNRLRQRGHFQQPESGGSILRQMEDLSSPIAAFVRERCQVAPGTSVICSELYDAWKQWCEPKGLKTGSDQTFGRDLRAAVAGIDTQQPRFGNVRVRVYTGIRLCFTDDNGQE